MSEILDSSAFVLPSPLEATGDIFHHPALVLSLLETVALP